MSNNWNIEADYAEYIEPDYSSFGNEKFPSHCRLRVRGGIKIDKKSLKATIYFNAISQASEGTLLPWMQDTYELSDPKTGSTTIFLPKLNSLSVSVYHQVYMGASTPPKLEPLELAFGSNLPMGMTPKSFNKEGKIFLFECAGTSVPIPLGSTNATLHCIFSGYKYGGYWAGSHNGMYADSMKPLKRTDDVRFKHTFTTAPIPSISDMKTGG
ncbi:hypothetical protein ABLA30_22925 [Xenorhabdus nematophila]|uniref:hypothetical protein n=1 Tax=Xenorhabdus nematophila TaxID=628 RepID=UPI0003A4D1AF|nr:hypothetical protein [Xenorhabdus nematophila]